MRRRKGYFSISAVAKMFSVHQQTIRLYEKEGLIAPKRSEGNTRLFSEEDVDRLEEIIYLTHKMGVNLAGVEIILKLQKKIQKLQEDMNKLFAQTQGQLEQESAEFKRQIASNVQKLHEIKKSNVINAMDLRSVDDSEKEYETEDEPASSLKKKFTKNHSKKMPLQMNIEDFSEENEKRRKKSSKDSDDWNVEYEGD